ncbi:hypothetical protein PPS11_35155 [Pseudomonas putida S11]|nr:hypothetical protein PPS11_35155 [Pseudomonas putida S11]
MRCDPPHARGKDGYKGCLILAHGAGAPMDSGFMDEMAQRLAALGVAVVRFEFPYMAERTGCRRQAAAEPAEGVAGMLARGVPAGATFGRGQAGGGWQVQWAGAWPACWPMNWKRMHWCAWAIQFYAVGKPEKPRVEHLAELKTPTLIVQGERDALGNREAVAGYALSPAIEVSWLVAGDHDLKPLKASGFSHEQHLQAAAEKVAAFLSQ